MSRRNDRAAGGQSRLLDRTIERLARDIAYLEREAVLAAVPDRRLELPDSVEAAERAAADACRWMNADPGPVLDPPAPLRSLGLLAF